MADNQETRNRYIEKYSAIALDCTPLDRTKAKEAVLAIYDLLGEAKPADWPVHFCDGPAEAWEFIGKQYGWSKKDLRDYCFPGFRGNFDADYIGAYDYCLHELGQGDAETFRKYEKMLDLCLTYILDDMAVCIERPLYIHYVNGNLHCEDGPAAEFRDGTKIWCIEGHNVDEELVMRPQEQSIRTIESESNGDIQAIRIERYGWPRYLAATGAECLDERENVIEGTYEALFSTENWGNRLVATCVTGRIMSMGVPPTVTTCEEAAAWLGGSSGRKVQVVGRT